MALFDKKNQKSGKREAGTIVPKNVSSPEKSEESERSSGGNIPLHLYTVLRSPRITEKASLLGSADRNVYAFVILQDASRGNVKNAVESLYKVNVKRVRMINVPAKKRRLGRFQGFRKGFKKAYVTLDKGEKIDLGTNV